jgi:hypothetical protein
MSSAAAKTGKLLYTGALSSTLKRLKVFSLASCGAALSGTPILFALESGVSTGGRIAIGSLVVISSLGSTGLIHFFTKPYVHKLYLGGGRESYDDTYVILPPICFKMAKRILCSNHQPRLRTNHNRFFCSNSANTQLVAETLSLTARPRYDTFKLEDVCVHFLELAISRS